MRTIVVLLLLVAAAGLAHAGEDGARVTVALRAAPESVVPGEAFEVELAIRYDRPYFEQHAAQLFRRTLDVPLQVTLPWLERPEGARRLPDPPAADGPLCSLVLNGEIRQARVLDSRDATRTSLAFSFRFLAERPGALEIPAPRLRYALADTFEEGLLGERVAVAPRFFERDGEALTVTVRPPPEPVPKGFTGAVGSTTVEASLDRDRVQVGEELRLTLRLGGADNLAFFDAPTLEGLEGFDVRGMDDDRGSPTRTIVYEIVPRSARVTQVPPIRFAYLLAQLPHGGQYVVTHTDPLFVTVTPAPGEIPADAPASDEQPGWRGWPYALAAAFVLLAVLAAGRRRRVRAPPMHEAAGERARVEAAAAALGARADERTLVAFLAARLGCSESAVIGPGLVARLERAGVARATAERTARQVEALVAARYGGAPASIDAALVAELRRALTA